MKIPPEVVARYGTLYDGAPDADAVFFTDLFDEPAGARVLMAGCHDESTANMLSDCGFEVVGFDLREYDEKCPRCNYRFVCGDFCQMPHAFVERYGGRFDAFVSLSSLEHFGLGTYGESFFHPFYDCVAMRTARDMLRPGGTAYVTVPFGDAFIEKTPDWRVYDLPTLAGRICAGFSVALSAFFTSGPCVVQGKQRAAGVTLTREEAFSYPGDPPHVTAFLKLVKP